MTELLSDPLANVVFWTAVGAAAIAVVIYIIGKIRSETAQHEPTASELMSKFREIHAKGGLSDEEFRTIKTRLAGQLENELKDNGGTG